MSGGWVPFGAAAWPAVAAALTAAGRPWPAEAVRFDLRWWADQERVSRGAVARPGRPALCARWVWGEKAARLAMADEARWGDPSQAPRQRASEGPAKGQAGASEGPAQGQRGASEGPEISPRETRSAEAGASEGPAQGQRGANPGPARGQPRASEGPHAKDTPSPSQTPSPPPPPHGAPPPAAAKGGSVQTEQVPGWLNRWATDCPVVERVQPAALARALLAATAAVTGRAVEAAWGGQPAAPWAGPGEGELRLARAEPTLTPAYQLWDSAGRPPLDAWVVDVELVARAARESPIPLFAREIRGEGEANRAGHQRSLKTVLNPLRFADRLAAARRWAEAARPAAPPALRLVDPAEAEARAAEREAIRRLEVEVGERAVLDAQTALFEAGVPADEWGPRLARLGRAESPRVALAAALSALRDQAQGAARAAGGGR